MVRGALKGQQGACGNEDIWTMVVGTKCYPLSKTIFTNTIRQSKTAAPNAGLRRASTRWGMFYLGHTWAKWQHRSDGVQGAEEMRKMGWGNYLNGVEQLLHSTAGPRDANATHH